jgi:hypothetical protein
MSGPVSPLHRRPRIQALVFAGALVVAYLLLRLVTTNAEALPAADEPTRFEADSAFTTTRLLADSFGGRVTGSEEAHQAAAWISARFHALGLDVETQDFEVTLRGTRRQARNVVARSRSGEGPAVVLMAHFDGQTTSGQSAGDNAAGVATLLELARVLETRSHRRPVVYVATDAKEWGSLGAARFAESLKRPGDVLAAVSLDNVSNGVAEHVHVQAGSQGPGFAPLWLRRTAVAAFASVGLRATDVGRATEWFQRTIRLSIADQGPLVSRGIPGINLTVEARDPEFARFLYHTPGDRWETLLPSSFALLGTGAERLALTLDRAGNADGPFTYFALGEGRMVRAFALYLAAVALFLPLANAVRDSWQASRADPAARSALRSEMLRALGWWLTAALGLGVTFLLVKSGAIPEYQGYPATIRDPFLYRVRWGPVFTVLGVLVGSALFLTWLRRRAGAGGAHPLAGRLTALATLLALAAVALLRNPFAAISLLAMPAWIWPWVGPRRRRVTAAASVLLVVASAVPFFVIAVLLARHLILGTKVGWYLFLQAAYGTWSPLTTVMFVVAILAGARLVGTATARLPPPAQVG